MLQEWFKSFNLQRWINCTLHGFTLWAAFGHCTTQHFSQWKWANIPLAKCLSLSFPGSSALHHCKCLSLVVCRYYETIDLVKSGFNLRFHRAKTFQNYETYPIKIISMQTKKFIWKLDFCIKKISSPPKNNKSVFISCQ